MILAESLDWTTVGDIASKGGLLTFVLLILYTGRKRVWVWGYQLDAAEKREADWKDMALRGTLIAERATKLPSLSVEQRLDALEKPPNG